MDASNEGDLDTPAHVVAKHFRIRYRRHGSGSPVILLRPPELEASTDAALLDGLAARFRVLVPVAAEATDAARAPTGAFAPSSAESPDDTLRWLTCFVEGLGVMGGAIVAAGRYQRAAVMVAEALPDQLARVVLLDDAERSPWPLPRIVSFLLREVDSRSS